MKVIVLKFEIDESKFSEELDSETIVNDIQDHLQFTYGDVFDWHNNDPYVDWKELDTNHKLLEEFDKFECYGDEV